MAEDSYEVQHESRYQLNRWTTYQWFIWSLPVLSLTQDTSRLKDVNKQKPQQENKQTTEISAPFS